jgi:hypothetical protein
MNKPAWNTIASRPSGTSFKWKFHGVGDGAAGCQIKALRAQEAYNGVATPPIDNPFMVQCLVSFDTIQVGLAYMLILFH